MEKINFRLADLSKDSNLLFTLDNVCFTRFFDNPSSNESELTDYLKDSQVYLYFLEDKSAGFFGFQKTNDKNVELKVLAVRPEYQGKGIGSQMINHFFELNKGCPLSLATHPKNSQAIIFYLKHGFMIEDWKENYYGDGEPRIILKIN